MGQRGCGVYPSMVSYLNLLAAALLAIPLVAQPKPQYEVYALRYATIPGFRVAGLVEGADKDRKLDIAMMVWLVRGNGRNILVDSGFYYEKVFPQVHPTAFIQHSCT